MGWPSNWRGGLNLPSGCVGSVGCVGGAARVGLVLFFDGAVFRIAVFCSSRCPSLLCIPCSVDGSCFPGGKVGKLPRAAGEEEGGGETEEEESEYANASGIGCLWCFGSGRHVFNTRSFVCRPCLGGGLLLESARWPPSCEIVPPVSSQPLRQPNAIRRMCSHFCVCFSFV